MNITSPQSWYDLPLMDPMDPRSFIANVSMVDNAGLIHLGQFQNSSSFLATVAYIDAVTVLSPISGSATPGCGAVAAGDYDALTEAIRWNASHGIVANNTALPMTVQRMIFVKAGPRFQTTIYLDWPGALTSTDIQLTFADNSAVGGNFINGASGTVPVFAWSATFGGTNKALTISTNGPGRADMVLRIKDSAGHYSMMELSINAVN